MFPLKMRPNKFFTLGIPLALSLASIALMLVLITLVRGDAPRAWGLSEFEAGETLLQNGIVRVEPVVSVVQSGQVFSAHIMIYDAVNLSGFQFIIDYDPNVIEVPQQPNPMILGDFLGSTGRTVYEWANTIDPTTGIITYSVFTTPISPTHPGPYGDGVLASVELRARALGTFTLDLKEVRVTDIGGNTQDVSIGDGLVIVASSPNPAQVSIQKSADPPAVIPQGLLTYTLQRDFSLAGQHPYDEIAFDPIPNGTTYLAGSAALNGLPLPGLYSATLDAIYYRHSGVFTDADQWTITFQVQVASLPNGTLIVNTITETTSFDGADYSGPYTGTRSVMVSCTDVTNVNLTLLTGGDVYTDTLVAFSADILPDDASKPYTYTIDYDDGTPPLTLASSNDPLALNHTFATIGSHNVEIAAWNCAMTEPVTDSVEVVVSEPCEDVSGVDLTLLTSGDVYTDTAVAFSADVSPDDASKPYTYTIDYDDGTPPFTLASSDDPLALNHTFATIGSHNVEIAAWNCAMTEPVTDSKVVMVNEYIACEDVTGVNLTLLTSGDIYTDTSVVFMADILSANASKPYTYTIDYDDGTAPLTLTSSDDPLTLTHTFATAGVHNVEIAIWNCAMTALEAVTDVEVVTAMPGPAPPPDFWLYLPLVKKKH